MVDFAALSHTARFSIKSLEKGRDPQLIHADVQALRSDLSALSGLEHTAFSAFRWAQRGDQPGLDQGQRGDQPLYIGLEFEAPLEKFRLVLQCMAHWLERTGQRSRFEVTLSAAHRLALQTDQPKVLAQLLPLVETLVPPDEIYSAKANRYVNTFGEITPAARVNLGLLQQRLGLTTEEANHLKAQATGPLKTLAEKYQHFRKELMACQQERDLEGDFWLVMQQKANTMSLPLADADFLKAERLQTLRAAAERDRQQAEAAAERDRQRQREQQQRLADYRRAFEGIVINALTPQSLSRDEEIFHQTVGAQLSAAIDCGRLTQAREFYRLSPQEANALEKGVLDELYLLSGLL